MNTTVPAPTSPTAERVIDVELLAIDLSTCTRCTGTLANVETAIAELQRVAAHTGTTIRLRKLVVTSEEEARRHRLMTSPTVRVDGRDVALDSRESRCDTCSELCGCTPGTTCRVWSYRGEEHDEAPVGLIVSALLREIVRNAEDRRPIDPPAPYQLPDNLRRFFAGRSVGDGGGSCCPPSELASCCQPEAKADCCGASVAA